MNWYIITQKDHLGPFERQALEELRKQGKLDDETLLWREGMQEPQSYGSLFLGDEQPPELPPEVLKRKNMDRANMETNPEEMNVEEEEPPLFELREDFSGDGPEEDLGNEKQKKPKRLWPKFLFFLLVLAGAAALAAGSWIYWTDYRTPFSRPPKMSFQDYQKLKRTAMSKRDEAKADFAMAEDKSGIWMALNYPLEGKVELKIKSLDERILAENEIEASARAVLKNRLAFFEDFVFEKGQRLAQGWYQVSVMPVSRLEVGLPYRWLNKAPLAEEVDADFRVRDRVLLATMSLNDFHQALERLNENREENESFFWKELAQKYMTVKAIARGIRKNLDEVFKSAPKDWQGALNAFEKEYGEKYGNFFTSFVVQNEKAYEEISEKTFEDKTEVVSGYTRLSRLAKRLGSLSMSSLRKMRALKDPSNKELRDGLRSQINESFDAVMEEIDARLTRLKQDGGV